MCKKILGHCAIYNIREKNEYILSIDSQPLFSVSSSSITDTCFTFVNNYFIQYEDFQWQILVWSV